MKANFGVVGMAVPGRNLAPIIERNRVDATIQALLPHLDKGDILIDGGNTFYKDIRRNGELANSGINFIGTGVSGEKV